MRTPPFLRSLCLGMLAITTLASAAELRSPDGKLLVKVDLKPAGDRPNALFYSVSWQDRPILLDSRLALTLENAPALDGGWKILNSAASSHDSTWKPVYGERSTIRDHYNQLVLDLQDDQPSPRRLQITFRAYNEGAAFCYTFPRQETLKNFVIASENTQFRFAQDHTAWAVPTAQGIYTPLPISQIKKPAERPLTVKVADDLWIAIGEARLVDYARMRLQPIAIQPGALEPSLGSTVKVAAPYTTPWRVIMVGSTPGQLLERNDIYLNLNDPVAIADTSWIKPGKVIREVSLSTEGGKACIDFAAAQNIAYIEYDAGWYGHEYDPKADARAVNLDLKRVKPGTKLNLEEVIRYGREKGVGVILYVNRLALEKQIDEILPLYAKWGIKGVKYGFVQVGPQQWTTWLHEAIRKAAAHKLMLDIHDEYRPTGYSRTYPNLMTVEGVRGNEEMPTAEMNCVLPFTRYLCGPADYTVCWYTPRNKNTRAHQLALSVVCYSPWQFVYWYDRPSQYQGEKETEFFKFVPTTWDDTRVLHGEIGQLATLARRSGDNWFVGTINAVQRRQIDIPLSFLEKGKRYTAHIYADASPDGTRPTAVDCRSMDVDSSTVLKADLAANGGQALRIVPR